MTMHFSEAPGSGIRATVAPCHFALSMEITFSEISKIHPTVRKNAPAFTMPLSINPTSLVYGSISIGHFALDHVPSNVTSLKDSTIIEF
jgi:hypothetical protein